MLESSGFDFRGKHTQALLAKIARQCGYMDPTGPVLRHAYTISLDLYRTFAPLKQTTITLAFASLELAMRLLGETLDPLKGTKSTADEYAKLWSTTRPEIFGSSLC